MPRSKLKLIAFDCFGTVFEMSTIPREEIAAYAKHVRQSSFLSYRFPDSWYDLKAHEDAPRGIKKLQSQGYLCVTLSNGSMRLLEQVSKNNHIHWDLVIDLAEHKVYKPNLDAYRVLEKETGLQPFECLMVTANPTFGDVEGAAAIGMPSQVIRQSEFPVTIADLADLLGPCANPTKLQTRSER